MASNNYTSANVTPSSDTFREWVDLTNRITYDMEKRVVTTATHSVGGGTTGNAYVNGFFSANTLYITDSISGAKTDDSSNIVGANSTVANVIFSSNVVFIANSSANAIIHAQSNVNFTGQQFTATTNADIDNAVTNINATAFFLEGTSANVESTTLTVNGTTFDVNSNVDIDAASVTIDGGTLAIGSNSDINANVDVDNALTDFTSTTFNLSGTTATIDSTTLNVNGTTANLNSNVDINNALTDITSTDTNISGSNVTIDSTHVDIHGTTLDINSNTNIDGDVTLTANATVGNANTDLLTVNSNTVLTDKLNVQEDVDLDSDLNVDGNSTMNGDVTLGNANTDSVNFIAEVSSGIHPESNTQILGLNDARWLLKANTINASGDITAQADVDVAAEANVNSLRVVTDASVEGNTILGNSASADVINTVARVVSSIEPTANGKVLGHANRRWDIKAKEINASNTSYFSSNVEVTGDIIGAADIDMTGEANLHTLIARSTSLLNGFVNAVGSVGVGANVHIGGNTYIHHADANGATTISNGNITVGNSTVNTAITPTSIDTDGTLDVLKAAALSNTLNVTGATVLGSTLNTTGSARFQSTANVDGLLRAKAGLITTGTANASVAMNVGANVNLSTSKVTVGDSTSNTTITKTAIDTDGQLIVAGNTTVGGDVDITGEVNASSAAIVGGAVVGGALDVNNTADFEGNVNFQDSITVADNSTFAGTLGVTKATTLSNTLTVVGKSTLSSANVSGTIQANGAVDFNSTGDFAGNVNFQDSITVADNSTFSKTLAAGNTTVTGFANVSGNIKAASANVSGHANLATIGASGAVSLASTLGVTGLGTFGSGINVTGTANVIGTSAAMHIGATEAFRVRLANNQVKVGNGSVFTHLTSASVNTTGTLVVGGLSTLTGNVTASGDIYVTGNTLANHTNTSTLNSTGAVDLDSTLNVDGATTLNGHIDLGANTSRTISVTGRVDTSLEPSATGKVLGHASRRWAGAFSTANTSGAVLVGTTLGAGNTSVTGFVNATTTGQFGGALTVGGNATVSGTKFNFGNSSINANLTANTSQTLLEVDKIVGANLVISGSASLPSDTTLTLAQANATNLSVTNNANFSLGSNVVVNFGDGNGRATINFANAILDDTVLFDDKLQVGTFVSGTSGAQVNSTAVEADNIYARNDLIANYSSDQRLKDQVIKIDTALNKIEEIGGYQFTWNNNVDDHRAGSIDYGVIAQEVEEILPHAVDINNRGYKTVNYNSLIPLLIEAVKELSGRVKELEKGDEIDG
jgi:hypothetical protein